VIKPKNKKEYKILYEMLDRIIEGTEIVFEKISNLYITSDLDAQELLFETDVVCGLRSTVLLEAAIAGKPVIIPYFKDLQDPKYDGDIFFRDSFHLFDIAKDVNELESLILKRLHNQTIDKKIMEGRKALFESFVSSLDGDATEEYVAMIKRVIVDKHSGHSV
jgi:CDP-glycerol glycerophosphotransferase (TagB/SpsB family)